MRVKWLVFISLPWCVSRRRWGWHGCFSGCHLVSFQSCRIIFVRAEEARRDWCWLTNNRPDVSGCWFHLSVRQTDSLHPTPSEVWLMYISRIKYNIPKAHHYQSPHLSLLESTQRCAACVCVCRVCVCYTQIPYITRQRQQPWPPNYNTAPLHLVTP